MKSELETLLENTPEKKTESDRKKTSLYLSDEIFKKFKGACKAQNRAMSGVLEEFMKVFADKYGNKKKGK